MQIFFRILFSLSAINLCYKFFKWIFKSNNNEIITNHKINSRIDLKDYRVSQNLEDPISMNNNQFIQYPTTFKPGITTNQYTYYYIYDYYPEDQYPEINLTSEQLHHRNCILGFNSQSSINYYVDLFESACINEFGLDNLRNYTTLFIPTSTINETRLRNQSFLMNFCHYTGTKYGFEMLINSSIERIQTNNIEEPLNIENFTFQGDFTNKKFLVIHDLRKNGDTSQIIYEELKKLNAGEIIFCYLGKTVPENYRPSLSNFFTI